MLFRRGNIYLARFNEDMSPEVPHGSRPVIVWEQYSPSNDLMVIPISSKTNTVVLPKRIIANIAMTNRNLDTVIMCDKPMRISQRAIITQLGSVTEETIRLMEVMLTHDKKEIEKNVTYNNNTVSVNTTLIIDDNKKLDALIKSLEEVKEMTKEANSPLNKWKERLMGFVFGIIASIIASVIYNVIG